MTLCFAVLAGFIVSTALGPVFIPFLLRLKIGQTVRDDGPESHLKKNGTPTMGGIIFLAALFVVSLFFLKGRPLIGPVLLMTLGFGLIGFIDDYIKVVLKRAMGFKAWQKMIGEIIVTTVFAIYMTHSEHIELTMLVPFSHGRYVDAGILTIPLMFFVILGTVNGANFTDGLDGLATKVTLAIVAFFCIPALMQNSGLDPVLGAMLGALLGFLVFNAHPANVFMGDTGSLALGAFVATAAYMLQMPLFIILVAFIYLAEVISVILQVGYFKLTHGKRIFKMAPIHHHFELCGFAETKVVEAFFITTIILCVVATIAYLY
ncbi:MAG: phospho-N-acetylmuramoyl-pentapeptide-transferase [Lachnospiraceae bacterium]|nr:phospho-N-acetylmuramoyl-pentapeptide-transferase [Lachnospiraceae bacterium]